MKQFIIMLIVFIVVVAASFFAGRCTAPATEQAEVAEYPGLDAWQTLELAIIKTESEFDASAIGSHQDIGVFQITPIYVAEVNRILDTTAYYHTDAFDIAKSLQMFEVYQSAKNPQRDIVRAIRLHNPGGDSIGYTDRVMANYRRIMEMEEVRRQLIEK